MTKAVATAGGFTYRAHDREVFITREGTGQEVPLNLTAASWIGPGDTIPWRSGTEAASSASGSAFALRLPPAALCLWRDEAGATTQTPTRPRKLALRGSRQSAVGSRRSATEARGRVVLRVSCGWCDCCCCCCCCCSGRGGFGGGVRGECCCCCCCARAGSGGVQADEAVGGLAGERIQVIESVVELWRARLAEGGLGCSQARILEADAGDFEAGEFEGAPREGMAQPHLCFRPGGGGRRG